MKKTEIKKIIAVTFIAGFVFFLNLPQVLVLAEEPTPTPSPTPDTVIQTGDANSNLNIENSANTNILTTPPKPEEELASDSNQLQEPPPPEQTASPSFDFSPLSSLSSSIENLLSNNLNQAEVANTGSSSAVSGQNEASSQNNTDSIIETGNANAQANVLNVANTNIIDSNGFFLLYNVFAQYFGNLDLRNWMNSEPNQCPSGCQLIENLNVSNQNTATVSNDIFVNASTGENTASSSSGDATILSGDANAGANVVNVVNTNIVGSNYLLVALNNFGDWIGDLVLPDKTFFEKLLGLNFPQANLNQNGNNSTDINNNNQAIVENSLNSQIDTGGNLSQGGNSTIATGNGQSSTNVANFINQNIYDSDNLFILIKVHGQWTGNVYGLPQGATWHEEDGQIIVEGSSQTASQSNEVETNSNENSQTFTVSNTNAAIIKNNVNVFALTGNNQVISLNGNGNILTGNAQAGTNVLNMVNTNIIGRNWVFALINIFGNWQGNLSFGQPDLFLGGKVEIDSLNYEFTIINRGDASATNIRLTNRFNETQNISNPGTGTVLNDNQLYWNLGTLEPGEEVTVNYQGGLNHNNPPGVSNLTTLADVTSYETDGNPEDNKEIINFRVYKIGPDNGPIHNDLRTLPKLTITKTNDASAPIKPNEYLKFTITLKNEGTLPAKEVVVTDKLMNGQNEFIHEETWNLGEVLGGEEIAMDYTITLNGEAKTGKYTNLALVEGFDGWDKIFAAASSTFDFIGPNEKTEESENNSTNTSTRLDGNGNGLKEVAEAIFGQKVEAKQEIADMLEETIQDAYKTSDSEKNLFGSLLLSMFGFLNDLPPVVLVLDALMILTLILLASKKRKKEDENPSDEESI